jgi:type I restriction enzyme S subunit
MSWSRTAVGDVVELVSGGTPPRNEARFWGGKIPWITCKDMKADRLGDSSERLTDAGLEAGSRLVPAGSLLIVIRGMILARDVPVALALRPVAFNQDLKALLPKPAIDGEFLLYALKSNVRDLQQMTARAAHGTKSLLTSNVADLQIPYPPLAEQRQIAAVLSVVQRAVERQERLIALTAELKRALMHKLFTEGTRGEKLKETEIGRVPEGWAIKRVAELCDLVSGGTPSKTKAAFWQGPIPWASPKDMKLPRLSDTQDHISQDGVETGSRLVSPGSIFVVIRGMILMRDVPVAQATVPMAFNQDMKALVNLRGVTSDFLLYALQNARDRLLQKVGSSAHGTRTLMTSAIQQLVVAVPDKLEQELISSALRGLEDKCDNHDRTRRCLQSLFRTLLHQLMTARVRVGELDLAALGDPAGAPLNGGVNGGRGA